MDRSQGGNCLPLLPLDSSVGVKTAFLRRLNELKEGRRQARVQPGSFCAVAWLNKEVLAYGSRRGDQSDLQGPLAVGL